LYELVYGTAPFFAPDIRQTYARIVDHEVTSFDCKGPTMLTSFLLRALLGFLHKLLFLCLCKIFSADYCATT
jgi:hypothetical protein